MWLCRCCIGLTVGSMAGAWELLKAQAARSERRAATDGQKLLTSSRSAPGREMHLWSCYAVLQSERQRSYFVSCSWCSGMAYTDSDRYVADSCMHCMCIGMPFQWRHVTQ